MIAAAGSRCIAKLRSALPIALAAMGSACASYLPMIPAQHRAEVAGAGAELSEMTVPGGEAGLRVEASLRAEAGMLLRSATLADAAAPACSSHDEVQTIWLDGRRHDRTTAPPPGWLTTLADFGGARGKAPIPIAGTHRLGLDFSRRLGAFNSTDATDPLRGPSVVDLDLATAAGSPLCLRVPLGGAAPELAWKRANPLSLGIAFRWSARKPTIAGVHESFTLGLRGGVWVHRRVRLGVETGATLPFCSGSCAPDVGSFIWIPLNAGGDVTCWEGAEHAFAVHVGYDALVAAGSAPAPSRFIQGARLALRFESTAARLPGLPSGEQISAFGYELWFATRSFDAAGSPTLVIGLGLIFDRGL